MSVISLHRLLLIGIAAIALSCQLRPLRHSEHISIPISKYVTFKGVVRDAQGDGFYAVIRCFSDSSLLSGAVSDVQNGTFSFNLPRSLASIMDRFEVSSIGFHTLSQPFDKMLLSDSTITLEFVLTLSPVRYTLVTGTISHIGHSTSDTIWLDPAGNRVTKEVSDSLWRDIPHK